VLVVPSRAEGLGRVVVEAFVRGRPVVAARSGGLEDLVADGVSGLLVSPEDVEALVRALASLLSDRRLAERLAEGAAAAAPRWALSPEDYAARVSELVHAVLAQ
jgi:glycosyltransferase involved in cell wall biosynthesis